MENGVRIWIDRQQLETPRASLEGQSIFEAIHFGELIDEMPTESSARVLDVVWRRFAFSQWVEERTDLDSASIVVSLIKKYLDAIRFDDLAKAAGIVVLIHVRKGMNAEHFGLLARLVMFAQGRIRD